MLTIRQISGLNLPIYPNSIVEADGMTFCLAGTDAGKRLCVLTPSDKTAVQGFSGEPLAFADVAGLLCPLSHGNAVALRARLPWLRPTLLGSRTSAGCGDRLGLATPGHIRAARAVGGLAMIFAQQSIREMTRTQRSPDDVMDDATWGIFQEGWRDGMGADADHLKSVEDIDRCVAAGFTFFTIDPSAYVDPAADIDDPQRLHAKYASLPWRELESTPRDLRDAYVGHKIDVEDRSIGLDDETLTRAAVKYGGAVANVAMLYRHLLAVLPADGFELEVSVDESDTPTSHAEHLFIARELRRLGVRWVSLAPRYVGRFEKGVDYIPPAGMPKDDLSAFSLDFAGHAAIARAFGSYKLSLHSGSDKFSIYRIAADLAHGLLHLKTAGTSYVEALRAIATFDTALFREIVTFAREHYETDKASYHISARLERVPLESSLSDGELPDLLDQFDARQMLHVTFGSVLTTPALKARLLAGLMNNEETHYDVLERHFIRHLQPMGGKK